MTHFDNSVTYQVRIKYFSGASWTGKMNGQVLNFLESTIGQTNINFFRGISPEGDVLGVNQSGTGAGQDSTNNPIPTTPTPTEPTPTPIPTTPTPIPTVRSIELTQGVWELKDDRITGETVLRITNEFPTHLLNINLNLVMQLIDEHGTAVNIKQNNVIFTRDQPDERIFYDEAGFGNKKLLVTQIVFDPNNAPMSAAPSFTITEGEPPKPPKPTPPKGGNFLQTMPYVLMSAMFLNSVRK